MRWKDIAKLGRDWAEQKRTELLTPDDHGRLAARRRQDMVEQSAEDAGRSFLDAAPPDPWARKITDNRPEDVEGRRVEAAGRVDAERRVRLAGQATGLVALSVSGDEQGLLDAELPVSVVERTGGEACGGDRRRLERLLVRVESPDAVPMGTTTLTILSLEVPEFAGAGRYDLADLMRRGEAGEIEWWDVLDIYLVRGTEDDGSTWYPDLGEGPAWVDVGEGSLSFSLPMRSALSTIRLAGTVSWA